MKKIIFHGSDHIIREPSLDKGRAGNDYGRGFYCTESAELAKEWACKNGTNGFANMYELEMEGLKVCNLNSEEYNILNWLALLTKYRSYWQQKSIAEEAKNFLQERYLIDISDFDVVIGYRADDSYYSFVQDFIMGTISLQKLSRAMHLGKLGEQVVLRTPKAFDAIKYLGNETALAEEYYVRKVARDKAARADYQDTRKGVTSTEEIYIIDILRGKVEDYELRI